MSIFFRITMTLKRSASSGGQYW